MGGNWSEDDLGKKETSDDPETGHVDTPVNEEPDAEVKIDTVDNNDREKDEFLSLVVFRQNFVTSVFVGVYYKICFQYI